MLMMSEMPVTMRNYFDLCIFLLYIYIIFVTSLASDTSYPVDKQPTGDRRLSNVDLALFQH